MRRVLTQRAQLGHVRGHRLVPGIPLRALEIAFVGGQDLLDTLLRIDDRRQLRLGGRRLGRQRFGTLAQGVEVRTELDQ